MKKIILLTVLIASVSINLSAQQDSSNVSRKDQGEIRTLFSGCKPMKVGYYIGAQGSYTQFKGKDVFLAGLDLGVIINHWLSVGLAGSAIVNSGNLWYNNVKDSMGAYLYGGTGGLKVEFGLFPKYPVHINFPLLIGAGGLVYNTWTYHHHGNSYNNNYYNNGTTLDWNVFFVVEPGVNVEANVVKFMRVWAGASYRYTPNLKLVNTPSDLINSFNLNFGIRFGKF
jgi:hypothetical protein